MENLPGAVAGDDSGEDNMARVGKPEFRRTWRDVG